MRAIKRLRSIIDLINDEDKVVADIGADHGYLSKIIIEEGRAKKVIATDISAQSLEKTAKLSQKFKFSNKIELRVGNGLRPFKKSEVDIAVIAGMGGYEIIKILENNNDQSINKFIFQPVQNVVQLRKYLNDNCYIIEKDFIIKDKNKFYNTIVAIFGKNKQILSDKEIEFGLTNFDLKSQDFYEYLIKYISKYEKIVESCDSVKNEQNLKNAKEILISLYGGE